MPSRAFTLSALENVFIVWVTSFLGLLLADGHGVNLSTLHSAAVSAVPAALSVAYSLLAGVSNGTASFVPATPDTTPPAPVLTIVPPAPVAAPAAQDDGAPATPPATP